MSVGENIKKYRKEKRLTQKQLAKEINLSEISIRRYEKNISTPTIEIIKKIAEKLKVPVSSLLGIEKLGTSDTYVSDENKIAHVFSKKVLDESKFGTEDIETIKLISAYIGRLANEKGMKFIEDWGTIIQDVKDIINADLEREKIKLGTKID
ncbi:helix-turn-helix domain-containing protein [Clostridium sp. Marseille-Q2269]|uniref:helix-turn-helix domain-containing protein n=1 Tax=Clostridium sp. Marseille-Q2269 TaxID=2942205 RepID=UPI00207377A5|nr:helix-turn-helix domain-containing protein [Clostridium sp. Marseille-Q2269]